MGLRGERSAAWRGQARCSGGGIMEREQHELLGKKNNNETRRVSTLICALYWK